MARRAGAGGDLSVVAAAFWNVDRGQGLASPGASGLLFCLKSFLVNSKLTLIPSRSEGLNSSRINDISQAAVIFLSARCPESAVEK